ncbi:glycerate kinase [Agromyces marinus]|uniref:glycerate kinase n=1 Tax=Agromyces marinus TaxID=1389020 RepID=UPI001F20F63B|nr:glycerate kinase [Agromyces marinus]UIP57851.1 Glycerate 2-kinase [Agromyces marinus]
MTGRIVFAPDSFKGTASAAEAAGALAEGWRTVRPGDDLVLRPMADGGEGTLDAFAAAVPGAERIPVTVRGPDDRPVDAAWLRLPDGSALVELAGTSGLTLLDALRPLDAHTFGFGEAVASALDAGATRLLLAIGGSSSTDAGAGALAALGASFRDHEGREVVGGARGLAEVASVDVSSLRALPPGGASILCDVTNPLLGPSGAAAVFGPQKGASAAMVASMDVALARFAVLVPGGAALAQAPGAGAAGGTGFGLLAWGARMSGGAAAVAEAIGLAGAIEGADLVVTGEGRFDGQSASGKAPSEVVARADAAGVPVALVAGAIAAGTASFAASVSLTDLAGDVDAARGEPVRWLRAAGARLASSWT